MRSSSKGLGRGYLPFFAEHVGMPKEVVPLAILRPLTGSGSLMVASAIQGSSDTTLYVITVYFGAIGVKKIRHNCFCILLMSELA
ncbi:MAG: Spore maturation protein B [Firmicutes bacterium]|nr:Spore maturation protein B [Bacillota bacterium]